MQSKINWHIYFTILFALFTFSTMAQDTDLNREEVTIIKKKLVQAQTAVSVLPIYTKDSEDFYLPTSYSVATEGKFYPTSSSLNMKFKDKALKDATDAQKKGGEEFQKKYADAMAKGNMEDIQKLTMEMQANQTKLMQISANNPKPDMNMDIQVNPNSSATIDPDNIVLEAPGVIALKKKDQSNEGKGEVWMYFDPINLKDTKKLSKFEMKTAEGGITKKIGVYNITVHFNGNLADAEAWAKKIDSKAILGLIDGNAK